MRARARRNAHAAAAEGSAESVVAIGPVKGDPQCVRVMVRAQGRSRARCVCTIRREQATALRIRVGIRWSASISALVNDIDAAHAAREAAMRAIATARRPISATALAHRLRERGHVPSAVSSVIRQLRSDGWISDRITAS